MQIEEEAEMSEIAQYGEDRFETFIYFTGDVYGYYQGGEEDSFSGGKEPNMLIKSNPDGTFMCSADRIQKQCQSVQEVKDWMDSLPNQKE